MKTRTIRTVYYNRKTVIRVNLSVHPNNAVVNCVNHMQTNHYAATLAEVYDLETGELHAVLRRSMSGMSIVFKREPTPFVKPGD